MSGNLDTVSLGYHEPRAGMRELSPERRTRSRDVRANFSFNRNGLSDSASLRNRQYNHFCRPRYDVSRDAQSHDIYHPAGKRVSLVARWKCARPRTKTLSFPSAATAPLPSHEALLLLLRRRERSLCWPVKVCVRVHVQRHLGPGGLVLFA